MADVIAIDGPAASGKSTTARLLAGKLGFEYLDTGAMYRAVALLCIRRGIPLEDSAAVSAAASSCKIEFSSGAILLDGEDVSAPIRTPGAGEAASIVSAVPAVRAAMVSLQRCFASGRPVVAEGRDMGTVVFPQARLKVFVIADFAVRVVRRLRELAKAGERSSFDDVASAMLRRDRRDRERLDSPLRPCPESLWLDTTLMSVDEQVEHAAAMYSALRGVAS